MEFTKQYPVIRYEDGRETPSMDEVLAECSLNVHINGRCTEVLHCIPEYLEEMLLGRLYTSGVISSPEDIRDLSICPSLNRADLKIRETDRTMIRLPDLSPSVLITYSLCHSTFWTPRSCFAKPAMSTA